ncbi:hypothetical protein N7492_002612 [Penicillium capsulatum]|uniref:SET domain-containing protein n=1 Tax=Penicillium capsulatum TaxID=69766 RepID=A0A9W9IKE5_9EURO|nr:hypothetical protein N7492_002612 [Penicillium capsulatum]KAJ6122786.1 hypothetical protein N7512_005251 [Penicillium capsulatum]
MARDKHTRKKTSAVDRWRRFKMKYSLDRPTKPTSSKPIAALYWDINSVCHFRAITAESPAEIDRQIYDQMSLGAQAFIDKALFDYRNNPHTAKRLVRFTQSVGWKVFAICAHAESFRKMCTKGNALRWMKLQRKIQANQRSLEVFARARRLEWRGPLLKHAQMELLGLRDALSPDINIAREHPHHLAQTLDGRLRRPRHNGKAQRHMGDHIFIPTSRDHGRNPILRRTIWGPCRLCESEVHCDCRIDSMAGDLVELVEYQDRGIGVRALANFNANDILGEYTGVIEQGFISWDTVYPLRQGVYYKDVEGEERAAELADIDASQFGMWTRYINHSCDPSATFAYRVVGKKATTTVEAIRDISTFEEVTVDYGDGYWAPRTHPCLCGSRKCRFPGR